MADDARHDRHFDGLVAGCAECDALAPDLMAIGAALASLRRGRDLGHRDFRITAVDAARLRRPGLRDRLRTLAAPRYAIARPLGGALTMIALVGLVTSSVPGFGLGGGAGREAAETGHTRAATVGASPSPAAPESGLDNFLGGAAGPTGNDPSSAPLATANELATQLASSQVPAPDEMSRDSSPNVIRLASIVLLLAGALLLVAPAVVRRGRASREP